MRLIKAFGAILLWSCLAFGADVKLAWDANDPAEQVTKYTVYEKVGANYIKIADAPTTNYTVTNVVPGKHVYVVTASNIWGESGPSNEAPTPNLNSPPKNLTREIVIP